MTLLKWCTQFSSVQSTQLCPTLCDPMDCSTPGFLSIANSQRLLKLNSWSLSIKSVMPSNHLILVVPFSCLLSFPASGSFPVSQFFTSGGQSIGASASASVLPVNIQDWEPHEQYEKLHSVCQQNSKTQQWPQDWKRSVFTPISKKGSNKECPDYHTVVLISYASKVVLKVHQVRLQ